MLSNKLPHNVAYSFFYINATCSRTYRMKKIRHILAYPYAKCYYNHVQWMSNRPPFIKTLSAKLPTNNLTISTKQRLASIGKGIKQ